MRSACATASIVLSIGLAQGASGTGTPQTSRALESLPSDTAAITRFIEAEMAKRHIPGVAVAVVSDSRVVYERAVGAANMETESPLKLDSVFEIASVTKPFTAAAVMMLVEQGNVNLDHSIAEFLPDAPAEWRMRTIRQTLSHTAGFAPDGIVRCGGSPMLTVSFDQEWNDAVRRPLSSAAGARAEYSDLGYFVLGALIQRVSGITYGEFLRRRIFEPLGMTNTRVMDRLQIVKGRVPVYAFPNGQLVNWGRDWRYELPSFFGVMSTVGDLAKWDIALRAGRVVRPESLAVMWTPATLATGDEARVSGQPYGLGWILGDNRGHRVAAHEGASGTLLVHFIDDPLSVIVLTNLGNPSPNNPGYLARGIAGLVRPDLKPPSMMAPVPDPNPPTTATVIAALHAVAAGAESTALLPGASSSFSTLPDRARSNLAARLKSIDSLMFLGADELRGRVRRNGHAVAQAVYYKHQTTDSTMYFSFWLTSEQQIADLLFSFE
jgi:D-alanyl-D-alanine carboxypeptidase